MSSSDHLARNVAAWTRANAAYADASARSAWASGEIVWGVFALPESELAILGDVAGLDVVELGCGTAYVSAWLARRGARVVGVDPTPAQLATARRMQRETGIAFPLVRAPAEDVPLPSASFDLAVSEHGASTWAEPERWIAEAARLLRPAGRLVFLHTTPLASMCFADRGLAPELRRPYFGLGAVQWDGSGGVEFQLPHGEWLGLLHRHGLEVERLVELQAPEGAARHEYYAAFDPEWARRWPAEEIWVARKRA